MTDDNMIRGTEQKCFVMIEGGKKEKKIFGEKREKGG